MEEMYAALRMWDDIFRQRRLDHSEMGENDYGTKSHAAEPYSCLQVWVDIQEKSKSFKAIPVPV